MDKQNSAIFRNLPRLTEKTQQHPFGANAAFVPHLMPNSWYHNREKVNLISPT